MKPAGSCQYSLSDSCFLSTPNFSVNVLFFFIFLRNFDDLNILLQNFIVFFFFTFVLVKLLYKILLGLFEETCVL